MSTSVQVTKALTYLNSKFQLSQLAELGVLHGLVEQEFPVCLWETEKINHLICNNIMLCLQMQFPYNC